MKPQIFMFFSFELKFFKIMFSLILINLLTFGVSNVLSELAFLRFVLYILEIMTMYF